MSEATGAALDEMRTAERAANAHSIVHAADGGTASISAGAHRVRFLQAVIAAWPARLLCS